LRIENYFRNKKQNLSFPTGPSLKARPAPARQARRGPSDHRPEAEAAAVAPPPWRAHPRHLGVRAPIKGEAKPPCTACPSPRALAARRFCLHRAACAGAEPSAAAAGIDFRRFAAMERLQVKTTTPGAPRRRAERTPPLPVAGGTLDRRHPLKPSRRPPLSTVRPDSGRPSTVLTPVSHPTYSP
jgi:hypothetical protein